MTPVEEQIAKTRLYKDLVKYISALQQQTAAAIGMLYALPSSKDANVEVAKTVAINLLHAHFDPAGKAGPALKLIDDIIAKAGEVALTAQPQQTIPDKT